MQPQLSQQSEEPFLKVRMGLNPLHFPYPIPVNHIRSSNNPNFSTTAVLKHDILIVTLALMKLQ